MNNDGFFNDFNRFGTASNILWGNAYGWEAAALPLSYTRNGA
jgi:hypothetical protein